MHRKRNTGYDLQTRGRIHKLARDYGINRENQLSGEGFAGECDLCKSSAASNSGSTENKGNSEAELGLE